MKVVVACGGTGGHAFPGLAVAQELKRRGHTVEIWHAGRQAETGVLSQWDGEAFSTGAKQLKAKNAFAILHTFFACRRRLKTFRPDILIAMGSYSSLPPVIAAWLGGVPVVLHEANTVPGRAVDLLSRFAKIVATSFPETANYLPHVKTVLTGVPIRSTITTGTRFPNIPEKAFVVFVTGGSQGAHRVNELASKALVDLHKALKQRSAERPLYVIHQTGIKDEADIMASYASAALPSRVNAFEREMPSAFASADLVIARAGASTCFELAACGKPVLFIPLPTALRDHQHENAQSFVRRQAANEVIQNRIEAPGLLRYLLHKYNHPEELVQMGENMKKCAVLDAAKQVADLLEKEVQEKAS